MVLSRLALERSLGPFLSINKYLCFWLESLPKGFTVIEEDKALKIQWFPGHMHRARKKLKEQLPKVDLVVEVLDARLPRASRNPLIAELTEHRPRVFVLTRKDLADPSLTRSWIKSLSEKNDNPVLAVDLKKENPKKKVIAAARQALAKVLKQRGGRRRSSIRLMVVGIPNVGKSTLINKLVGRKVARTGNEPAVTRGEQWVRIDKEFELLDTPGLLWPKFEDPEVARCLALSGAIRDTTLPLLDLCFEGLTWLHARYPAHLKGYGLEAPLTGAVSPQVLLEGLAKKRGCLQSGGVLDLNRAGELFLRELRAGKLGALTFESPVESGELQ